MAGPLALAILVGALAFGVGGAELWRAPRELVEAQRKARGRAWAWLASLWLLWPLAIAPALLGERDLDVAPPPRPLAGKPWDLDLDFTNLLLLMAGGFIAVEVGLIVVAWAMGRRRGAVGDGRGVPRGDVAWRAGWAAWGLATLAVVVRLAIGGVPERSIDTYGAIVPGVKGWRAERVLARTLRGAKLAPLLPGEPLAGDSEYHHGSDCCGALAHPGGTHEVEGTKAWIGGAPVVLQVSASGVKVRDVAVRDPAEIPDVRRPHFRAAPEWAPDPREPGVAILVERRDDGALQVLRLYSWDTKHARLGDAGLVLAAPWWPIAVLLALGGLASWLGRKQHRRLALGVALVLGAGAGAAGIVPYL